MDNGVANTKHSQKSHTNAPQSASNRKMEKDKSIKFENNSYSKENECNLGGRNKVYPKGMKYRYSLVFCQLDTAVVQSCCGGSDGDHGNAANEAQNIEEEAIE